MTVYKANYIKDESLILNFNLTNIDEVYRNIDNSSNFIFKLGEEYYNDTYGTNSYNSLLFTNNKILKFSKVTDSLNYVHIYYKLNTYLSSIFGVDIYKYSSYEYKGNGYSTYLPSGYYYVVDNVAYMSEYPFASMSEILLQEKNSNGFYTYSDSTGYATIASGVMTRFGKWRDEVYITGSFSGDVLIDKNSENMQAMATTPSEITLSEYLNSLQGNNTSDSGRVEYRVLVSDTLAGIYSAPIGSTIRIGYELWTYTETINDKSVDKEVRKNIELFQDIERGNKWFIDDYSTSTEPVYSNSPQTLTRESDSATIEITFDEYVSASEMIATCEGQSWR